jgi:deoxyribodipyrimidine photo-lyase
MNDLFDSEPFEPTVAAAHARIAAVRPDDYARTRNAIDGAVTRLSPYITHGFVTLPEVLAGVRRRHAVSGQHKFVQELGWREYFHHVWRHEGERIFTSMHPGPLPDDVYAPELPEDIRRGATGVPAIDTAVRELYATGWLHNHARLWLASYVVHLRKVHWRAGADWLYGHLIDGDLASNHLSWQWVAGTGSAKPYLFNAGNVARYAPPAWHSEGTPVDATYEALERIARSGTVVPGGAGTPVDEPPLSTTPPADVALRPAAPPRGAWLVHAWALGPPPAGPAAVPVFVAAFHRRWPWSARRWSFVATRMAALGGAPHWCEGGLPAQAVGLADPHLADPPAPAGWRPVSRLFDDPGRRCASFSQFWARVSR